MDHDQSFQPPGEFQNSFDGDMHSALLNLPIDDFVERTQALIEAQEPQVGYSTAQSSGDGCLILNRTAAASKAIPETACEAPMTQNQAVAGYSTCPNTPAVGGQAAFYNANTNSNGMSNGMPNQAAFYNININSNGISNGDPNQTAFYNANINSNGMPNGNPNQAAFNNVNGGSSAWANNLRNSADQRQKTLSLTPPGKRSFAAAHQDNNRPTQGRGIHPEGVLPGNVNGNSPSTQGYQPPEKRQCIPTPEPNRLPIGEAMESGQERAKGTTLNGSREDVTPPGRSGQSRVDRGSIRDRTGSGASNASVKSSFNCPQHPNSTDKTSPHMEHLVKLDLVTKNALKSMHSYMYKVLKTKCTFDNPGSAQQEEAATTSARQVESTKLVIRILHQFLIELRSNFQIKDEGIPLTCLGIDGELGDLIGRQQCIIALAFFPQAASMTLDRVRKNPDIHRLAFQPASLVAIKHGWMDRLNAWWTERKSRLEVKFRMELCVFMGYGPQDGVVVAGSRDAHVSGSIKPGPK